MGAKHTSHWPITVTNGAASLLAIFLPLVLVRVLSVEQMGRYNIFFLYATLVPSLIFVAGLSNGLYFWTGKGQEGKDELRASWTLLLGLTTSFAVVGFLLSRHIALHIKLPYADLQIFLLCAPLLIISSFLEDLMIARGNIWLGSFYSSGFNVIKAAGLVLAAWLTHSLLWVFGVLLAGTILRVVVGGWALRDTGELKLLFSREKVVSVLRYALPVSVAGLAGLAINHIDQMILSVRISPSQFALYAMGCLSVPPLDIFETSVNRVLIPRLSHAFQTCDLSRAATLLAEGTNELFRVLLPASVGLIIYAEPIVRILFTSRYLPAAHFLRLYAFYYLLLSFNAGMGARARGDGKWILQTTLLFACLGTAMTWIATGRWGATGALTAVLVGQFLYKVYSLGYYRRCLQAPISKFLPIRPALVQIGLVSLSAGISMLLRPLFSDPRMWFLLTGPLFTLVYFGAIYSINLRRYSGKIGPVRVLQLTQTLGLGGLERTIYSIAEYLNQEWDFRVRVAVYDADAGQPDLAERFRKSGIPLVQWKKEKGFSISSVWRLVRLIRSERAQIVHAHDLGPLIYGVFAKWLTLGQVRLVVTVHTLLDIEQKRRYRLYYKVFLRFTDNVIAVSPGVHRGILALGVDPDKVAVIPNGVCFTDGPVSAGAAAERASQRKALCPGLPEKLYHARWAISLARLHPGKGQDVLLHLWSALPETTRRGLVLFFVGQATHAGYEKSLRERIRTLPDANRIVVAGPSDHPEQWIQYADLFISGSLLEGMPLAPLEAAGSGLPALLSDIEGHRFLKNWACFFDPANPQGGAERVQEILAELDQAEAQERFFENRWQKALPLREQWGVNAMTACYARLFQLGASQ